MNLKGFYSILTDIKLLSLEDKLFWDSLFLFNYFNLTAIGVDDNYFNLSLAVYGDLRITFNDLLGVNFSLKLICIFFFGNLYFYSSFSFSFFSYY